MFKKIFLILILAIGIFAIFSSVFALEVDWPPSPLGTDLKDTSTLTDLVQYFYEWGIALGGLAAFIALLIAGFMYLTSVGDPQKMAEARGRIIWALFGLVLLLAAWIILNTINPDLTKLLPPSFGGGASFLLCDTNADCKKCDDKNQGDGKKDGHCVYSPDINCDIDSDCSSIKVECKKDISDKGICRPPKVNDKPLCSYARVWGKKDFQGASTTVNFNTDTVIPGDTDNGNTTGQEGSIMSFFNDSSYDSKCSIFSGSSTACLAATDTDPATGKITKICDWNMNCFQKCGTDGCGCTLELYDKPGCWDAISPTIQSYSTNLKNFYEDTDTLSWGDGRPSCVILKEP